MTTAGDDHGLRSLVRADGGDYAICVIPAGIEQPDDAASMNGERRPDVARACRVALAKPDSQAVAAFVAGDATTAVEHVRMLAEALILADANGARLRTVARALASARTQICLVDAAIGQAMGRRDLETMAALVKLGDQLTRRLGMLLDQHRRELGHDRSRGVLMIGAAQNVNVGTMG